MPIRLKRPKPGDPISASLIADMMSAIERCQILPAPGGGITISPTACGVALSLTGTSRRHLAITTSSITAASGLTYGFGTATFLNDNGTSLSTGTLTIPKLKNYHDKTIANGSVVWVDQAADGSWWVIDVAACTNLS